MQRPRLKMRLGDLLVHEGIISEQQLSRALAEQKTTGRIDGMVALAQAVGVMPSISAETQEITQGFVLI